MGFLAEKQEKKLEEILSVIGDAAGSETSDERRAQMVLRKLTGDSQSVSYKELPNRGHRGYLMAPGEFYHTPFASTDRGDIWCCLMAYSHYGEDHVRIVQIAVPTTRSINNPVEVAEAFGEAIRDAAEMLGLSADQLLRQAPDSVWSDILKELL